MAWTALSIEDLKGQLTAGELEAMRTVPSGQADPALQALARGIEEVRSYIPQLRADPTLAPGLLPAALHAAALDLVRYRLCTSLASGAKAAAWLITEPRQRAFDTSLSYLRDVARGLVAVEPPPAGTPPANAPAPGYFGSDTAWGNL